MAKAAKPHAPFFKLKELHMVMSWKFMGQTVCAICKSPLDQPAVEYVHCAISLQIHMLIIAARIRMDKVFCDIRYTELGRIHLLSPKTKGAELFCEKKQKLHNSVPSVCMVQQQQKSSC